MIYNCDFDTFNDIVFKLLTASNTPQAALYMRSGYSKYDMQKQHFSVEFCGLYYGGCDDGISWFDDWYEGQNYFEIISLITEDKISEVAHALRYNIDTIKLEGDNNV